MKLEELKVGTKLNYWHDAGIKAELGYAEVIKVGKKKVKVRGEQGEEGWKYPSFFNRIVSDQTFNDCVSP